MTAKDKDKKDQPDSNAADPETAAPAETPEPQSERQADPEPKNPAEGGNEDGGGKEAPEGTPEEAPEDPPEDPPEEAPQEEDLEAKVADLTDKLLRALAETENMRRRAQRDKEDASKYAITNFARDMLTLSDSLHRAMDSVDAETREKDAAVERIMAGLEMTAREVRNTFERFGVKTIEAMGEKFDHNLHEAMFELEDASKPAGTVVQVVETGYVLNDRLLRPSKVGVSKGGPRQNNMDNNKESAAAKEPETPAAKEGQAAYEDKGEEPGAQLDEEL